jgi:hypothetical protein
VKPTGILVAHERIWYGADINLATKRAPGAPPPSKTRPAPSPGPPASPRPAASPAP